MPNPRAFIEQRGAELCIEIFKKCINTDLKIEYPSELIGVNIQKDQLDKLSYEDFSSIIQELRKVYSASGMRCLRSDAHTKKTPILNLLRQVAKANGLILDSNRKSDGYWPDGRKKLIYWYTIRSLDGLDEINTRTIEETTPDVIEGTLILSSHSKTSS